MQKLTSIDSASKGKRAGLSIEKGGDKGGDKRAKKRVGVAAIALIAIALNFKILRDGVIFNTHDLHVHLRWLQHFYLHLSEGSWYPRWLAELNYGYGSPAFVFYPPAVVYFGSVFKALGFNTERSMALVMLWASFAAGLGFYLYGLLRWRSGIALLGAVAYMSAPYLIYNTYHRGAMAEVLATSLLPFGLFLTDRALRGRRGWLALTLFFALLSLTHLPSLLLYVAAWSIYVLSYAAVCRLPLKKLFKAGTAAALGFGLSAFYLVPAILEKKLVNLNSMRKVSGGFMAHFVPFGRNLPEPLVPIFWYGLISALVGLSIAVALGVPKSTWVRRSWPWLLGLGITVYFMTPLSRRLWAASPTLQMVQFPWRLMGVFSLIYAGVIALALDSIWTSLSQRRPHLWRHGLAVALLLGLLVWNWQYAYALVGRYPGFYAPGDLTEARASHRPEAKFFDAMTLTLLDPHLNQSVDVPEYLPRHPITTDLVPPPLAAQPPVTVAAGHANLTISRWQGNYRRVLVQANEPIKLHFRTYDYPAWHAYVDGAATAIEPTDKGLIGLAVEPGEHTVEVRYQATSASRLGTGVSGLSAFMIAVLALKTRRQSVSNKV